jgi:hypothetical protein
MAAQDHDSQADARLRQTLGEMDTDTSAAHDGTVLARARVVADGIAAGARREKPRRSLDWARPLGLAAAVAIAIIGLSWVLPGIEPQPIEQLRGAKPGEVFPQAGVLMAQGPTEFRWSAQAGATQYQVTLRDASAEVVWRSAGTKDPQVQLDPTANLQKGGTYFWTVRVEGAGAPRELGPFMFQIAGP